MTESGDKLHPRSGDAEVLALAESLVSSLGKTYDRGGLETLRDVVDSYPNLVNDGSGEVVQSLLGLIRDLMACEQSDKEALGVHVRAWRFMVSRTTDHKERRQLLDGLRSVRELYEDKSEAA